MNNGDGPRSSDVSGQGPDADKPPVLESDGAKSTGAALQPTGAAVKAAAAARGERPMLRTRILNSLAAVERYLFRRLCALVFVAVTPDQAKNRACEPQPPESSLPNFTNASGEVLLDQAIRYYEAVEGRHETVKDKGKTILPLLAVVASVVTLSTGFFGHGAFLLVPVVFALATVWLHQEILALGWSGFPLIDQSFVNADDNDRRAPLAFDYLKAARLIDSRTDYSVLVLTAARRAVGLTLLAVIVVVGAYAVRGSHRDSADVIQALRSDPGLIDVLRGPKGEVGATGPRGSIGPRGPEGPKGEAGPGLSGKSPKPGGT